MGLLGLISRGDHDAFGRFYDATSHTVFGMALAVLGDKAHAETVAEAIYIAAWKLAPTFDATLSKPDAWLAAITGRELTTRCLHHPIQP